MVKKKLVYELIYELITRSALATVVHSLLLAEFGWSRFVSSSCSGVRVWLSSCAMCIQVINIYFSIIIICDSFMFCH